MGTVVCMHGGYFLYVLYFVCFFVHVCVCKCVGV
jgi:hypothetical protein